MSGAYRSNATWAQLARAVRTAERIALVTHARPDGDALGSVLALARTLPRLGKKVECLLVGPLEPGLRTTIGDTPVCLLDGPPDHDVDLVIVVDTGAWSQLAPLEPWLRRQHDHVIGIDHHAHGDDVAALRVVDPTAAAAAQLVVQFIDELGCSIDGGEHSTAEALYLGLATDTGWFRYANADARAFALAARLLRAGVNKTRLYQVIEETFGPERLALEARALASVEYSAQGAVAIQSLGPKDFEATGTSVEHLTGLVNGPMIVGTVQVSILLAEVDPGITKISFRAKPALGDATGWDVNALAQKLGGGGHIFAAGARVDAPLAEARKALLSVLA